MNNYKFKNYNIFVSDELFKEYKDNNDLLYKDLLTKLYSYLMLILNNNLIDGIVIKDFSNTDNILIKKCILADKLKDFTSNEELDLRFNKITNLTNYNKFMSDYNDSVYKTILNNKVYSIPVSDIIKLFNVSDKDFKLFLNNLVPMKYDVKIMLYLIIDFINKEHIGYRYNLSDKANLRINYVRRLFSINYEVELNDIVVDDQEKYLEGIKGISKLEDAMIICENMNKEMPEDYVYTYAKLLHMIGLYPFVNTSDLYGDVLSFHYGEFDVALNDGKLVCKTDNEITLKKFKTVCDGLKYMEENLDEYALNKKR